MEDVKKEFETVKNQGFIKTFLNFDKMMTPAIIKIIFYIGLVLSVLVSLGMIISGMNAYYGGGAQVFLGIIMLFLSPITIRVYCELLIVIFKIHESLVEIKNK
ncbi:DUF4282 domain-containing protein [Natronincola ferrireducens]|uniref:DUF4282 domain-containing protein n=1 Tax=Natronincola ferrireducens TaxID=393762 RepID=A0A1G8XKY2_9FIRM|nr:DUF4282 domain-containing protein [Natronincola ferrireducens]SDJ91269.1 protein of unknown function [Natronincola ferrireducens]